MNNFKELVRNKLMRGGSYVINILKSHDMKKINELIGRKCDVIRDGSYLSTPIRNTIITQFYTSRGQYCLTTNSVGKDKWNIGEDGRDGHIILKD